MIDSSQAWHLIVTQSRALPPVDQPADRALGQYLCAPVTADRDQPPANRAAMDGFAVRAATLEHIPAELPVAAELAAGAPADQPLPAGACVRIFTGANLPPGADTVVMQEDTEATGSDAHRVRFLQPVVAGANVYRQGENARRGESLLPAGTCLNAAALALCAAVGRTSLPVHRRPTVALLTTGSELLEAADAVLPHQLRDSNGPFLRAALAAARYPVSACERVADDPGGLVAALQRLATGCDVVIMTGGMSVGRYDFAAAAVRQAGGSIHFHGVAMKPGKPQLFATDAQGRLFFGLPGNPVSAMVGFHEFVLPALHRLAGCAPERCRRTWTVRTAHALTLKGRRQHILPATLRWTAQGPVAATVPLHGSADLVAGARADGALLVPPGTTQVPAGESLDFRPWSDGL